MTISFSTTTAGILSTVVSTTATTTATTITTTTTVPSFLFTFVTTIAVAVATTTAIVLLTLPLDDMNRSTFMLRTLQLTTAQQLWRKRIVSYQYRWNQAFIQQIRIFYNYNTNNNKSSSMNNNNNNNNTSPPMSSSSSSSSSTTAPAPLNDNTNIELLITNAEVEEFILRILRQPSLSQSQSTESKSSESSFMHELRVIHIGRDSECMMIPNESKSYPSTPIIIMKNHMLDHYFCWFQYYYYYSNNNNNNNDDNTNTRHRHRVVVQVPLLLFSRIYHEQQSSSSSSSPIRTTTFCFIYDTTQNSYMISNILFPLLTSVTKLLSSFTTNNNNNTNDTETTSFSTLNDDNNTNNKTKLPLNCYPNPAWMVQLSILLLSAKQPPEQPESVGVVMNDATTLVSYEQQIKQCFMTFCNIESYYLCEQFIVTSKSKHSGTSSNNNNHHFNTNNNVMIYTIPTSVIPILLPTLHDLYPDDRHVFLYTGCIQAIQMMSLSSSTTNSHKKQSNEHYTSPPPQPYTFHSDTVAYTVPIYMNNSNTLHSSTVADMISPNSKRIGNVTQYYDTMSRVPIHMASQIECYMAAIHTLFERQHQMGIAFLPYICKMDYLIPSLHSFAQSASTTTSPPAPVGSSTIDPIKIRYSVRSLLQYITGSKSREMSHETLDAAVSFLQEQSSYLYTSFVASSSSNRHRNWYTNQKYNVTPILQKSIEQIIFQHKLLLLPNKTLLDTVQPVEQWTLKQPTKNGGCACCDEEPDDNDEMDIKKTSINNPILVNNNEMTTTNMTDQSLPLTRMINKTRNTIGYVDGKMKFAFDPTQFA